MSQLLARIMLAIFMLPCAAVLYVGVFVVANRLHLFAYPSRRYMDFIVPGLASWIFIAIYWVLLWRSTTS